MDAKRKEIEILFVRHGQSTENSAIENGEAYDHENIVLTDRGKIQAEVTGEYLKMFGKYDIVYHSPLTRCVQTSDIICKVLEFKGETIKSDLIIELGAEDNLQGLTKQQREEIIKNNKEYIKLEDLIKNEKNLFKKAKLQETVYHLASDFLEMKPSLDKHISDSKKFIDVLKKQNCERILVICHGGTIFTISRLITNINPNTDTVAIMLNEQTVKVKNPEPIIENDNCCIMGVLLKDNVLHMVIPRNNLHLKNLIVSL
jgi:broad specificity phosphatase PhoE